MSRDSNNGPLDRFELDNETDPDGVGHEDVEEAGSGGAGFHSGFVAIVGRPNVGKSTLLNQILRTKVSITSRSPNTTRTAVRGVLDGPGHQIVFVDTPGIHKPRSALGVRLNEHAEASLDDVDATVFVIDATQPVGSGDRFIAASLGRRVTVVMNKIDAAATETVFRQLELAARDLHLEEADYFPISARTGRGVPPLVAHLVGCLPEGPRYYPTGMVRDVPEAFFVAELVREQLLRVAREELPHSIACRVTEWEWPYIRCEILVERESQKAIVIGRKAAVLKAAGEAARAQLAPGAYLDLHVRVERDWQRRRDIIEQLGY